MDQTVFHSAGSRGHASHGWLDTYHTFSFAGYNDPARVNFGALRVLNDDIVKGGFGFGKHPHDNMEIITVVLDGALEHQDTMGHTQAIHPNEVQVMSAGTGLYHSEYNHNKDKDVNLLQLWILPKKYNIAPRYDQKMFPAEDRVSKLQMLVSPLESQDEGLKINQDAWIYRTALETGKEVTHKLHNSNNGIYAFVMEGNIIINGNELSRRDGIGIQNTNDIVIAAKANSDVLLLELPMI